MLDNVTASSGMISLDDVAFFPSRGEGDLVFCASFSVTSAEFANVGLQGIRAEYKLVIATECDKRDKLTIRYRNKTYAIYRRYTRSDGLTELYLEEKAGVR